MTSYHGSRGGGGGGRGGGGFDRGGVLRVRVVMEILWGRVERRLVFVS